MKNFINTSFYALACLSPHFKTNIESLSFLRKFSGTYFYLRKPILLQVARQALLSCEKTAAYPMNTYFPWQQEMIKTVETENKLGKKAVPTILIHSGGLTVTVNSYSWIYGCLF